jgi:transketolase
MAMGLQSTPARVFCLLGDGEIQEGQIWEAALSAPKFGLSNLCAILDANNGQIDGPVNQVMPLEPIADKWRAFGWHVIEIDGHDFGQILSAYQEARNLQTQGSKKPVFILARTIKGKGVSFMENNIAWHGAAPNLAQCQQAVAELSRGHQND